ncbi:hypothetical protein L3V16_21010 [Brucella ciceri]|uniref:hypothetical protein n=1 Tax=Brucella ciceri TaxID=391287 RepID=UPI000DE46B19|nr:hypothetical protein [Brucella ciceri]MCH6206307.1 hypothetical protein [Brucella ciceri]
MTVHELLLAYQVTGKTSHARRASTFKIAESVSVPVPDISNADLMDGMRITIDSYSEVLKFYDGRFWIQDRGAGRLAGVLRAQAGLIDNYRLARALESRSTFEVFHYRDPELFDESFQSASLDELKDVNDEGKDVELDRLVKSAAADLLDVDGVLYYALGEPVHCLRLLPDTLQVLVSFQKSNEGSLSDIPTIRIPIDDMSDGRRLELDALIDIWRSETGKSVTEIAHAELMTPFEPHLDYSPDREIARVATEIVQRTTGMVEWPTSQIIAWAHLRDALKAYRLDQDGGSIDALASRLVEYGDAQSPSLRAYIRMLQHRSLYAPISIPEIA